jgi:hypothetical protein
MKHPFVLLSMLSLVAGCHQRQPKVSEAALKQIRALSPGITDDCLDKIKWGGFAAMPGVEDCEAMSSEKVWTGLWRAYFEDDRFCEAPAKQCDGTTPGIWVRLDTKVMPKGFDYRTPPGGLYGVQIIGRETLYPDRLEGVPKKRLVVHKFTSVKQVEGPPPQPTKAEMIKSWIACEAAHTCRANWSEINKIQE